MTTELPAIQMAQHLQGPGLRTCLLVATAASNKSQINKPTHTFIGLSEKAIELMLLAQASEFPYFISKKQHRHPN